MRTKLFTTVLCVLALLLSTAATVGVTWDEPIYSQAAENAARWFGTLRTILTVGVIGCLITALALWPFLSIPA